MKRGLHSLALSSVVLLGAGTAAAQDGLSIVGGTLTVGSGATLSVLGAVSNAGTLDNQGTLNVGGHLTNTGTIGAGAGTWVLNGTVQQNLSLAGGRLPVAQLNNAAGLALTGASAIGTFTLTNGAVWLHASDLTVDGPLSGVSSAAGRYVISDGAGALRLPVGTAAVTFPLATAPGTYRPVQLQRSAGTGTYAAAVAPDALLNGASGPAYPGRAVALHWTTAAPDATPYSLTVEWLAADELPLFQRSQSALTWWTGSQYQPLAGFSNPGGPAPYRQSLSNVAQSGLFIVLDRNAPLPVELTGFAARRPAGRPQVELDWTTAQEKNNAGFAVERRDEGQTDFRRVGYVPGAGTSTSPRQYRFTDTNDYQGLSYYRLRQLDEDGTATLSAVRTVTGLPVGAAFSLAAFPSPASQTLTLEAAGRLPENLTLTLFAADGRLVRQEKFGSAARRQLDVQLLPSGWYWLRYAAPAGLHGSLPVLIQH